MWAGLTFLGPRYSAPWYFSASEMQEVWLLLISWAGYRAHSGSDALVLLVLEGLGAVCASASGSGRHECGVTDQDR